MGRISRGREVFQVRGLTENTPTAGQGPGHFHAIGWGCEQMQLWFIWRADGKRSHLYCTMPTMGTACFISYRCLPEEFCKTLAHIDFLLSLVDVAKLLLYKYLLYFM